MTEIPLSTFLSDVDKHQITSVNIRGQQIYGQYSDGHQYSTFAPEQTDVVNRIADKGEVIKVVPEEGPSILLQTLLLSWGPMLLWSASGSTSCARCSPVAARRWALASRGRAC